MHCPSVYFFLILYPLVGCGLLPLSYLLGQTAHRTHPCSLSRYHDGHALLKPLSLYTLTAIYSSVFPIRSSKSSSLVLPRSHICSFFCRPILLFRIPARGRSTLKNLILSSYPKVKRICLPLIPYRCCWSSHGQRKLSLESSITLFQGHNQWRLHVI